MATSHSFACLRHLLWRRHGLHQALQHALQLIRIGATRVLHSSPPVSNMRLPTAQHFSCGMPSSGNALHGPEQTTKTRAGRNTWQTTCRQHYTSRTAIHAACTIETGETEQREGRRTMPRVVGRATPTGCICMAYCSADTGPQYADGCMGQLPGTISL